MENYDEFDKFSEIKNITLWLSEYKYNNNPTKKYTYRLLKENLADKADVIEKVKEYVKAAHNDTIRRLKNAFEISLDPLALGTQKYDASEGYPEVLPLQTLKGYFGEIMAGIIAENIDHFGVCGWKVPAYLFRYHEVAIQSLDEYQETGEMDEIIPGRTGDDCLAFKRDNEGKITDILFCEAKCLKKNNTSTLADAFKKLSSDKRIPVDLMRLKEILEKYNDSESRGWVISLCKLSLERHKSVHKRYDMLSYICGNSPKTEGRDSWIDCNEPHIKYTAGRDLEAVEIQIDELDNLIIDIYRR